MAATAASRQNQRKTLLLILLCLVLVGLWLRVCNAINRPLWLDEIASLVVASGHTICVNGSAPNARPGDVLEVTDLQKLSQAPHFAPDIPAVLKSNGTLNWLPPVYPTTAHVWLSFAGSDDISLRLFSLAWWLASVPIVWLLARRVAGKNAALLFMMFFILHPTAIHYSVEARNYSLMIFLGAALLWTSIRLHDKGPSKPLLIAWVATAVSGMLTHYFFVPTAAAAALWLWLKPGKTPHKVLLGLAATSIALVLPWYVLTPRLFGQNASLPLWFTFPTSLESAANGLFSIIFWQIGDAGTEVLAAIAMFPLAIIWAAAITKVSFFRNPAFAKVLALLLLPAVIIARPFPLVGPTIYLACAYIGGYILAATLFKTCIATARSRDIILLLYLTIASACVGPIASYAVAGGRLILCQRYYLCALIPCLILFAMALTKMSPKVRMPLVSIMLAIWFCLAYDDSQVPPFEEQRYVAMAQFIDRQPKEHLLLFDIMHEDVPGVARKISPDRSAICWYDQGFDSETLQPAQTIEKQLHGKSGVILVQNRQIEWQLGWPDYQSPLLRWLKRNARLASQFDGTDHIYVFVPKDGEHFGNPTGQQTP